MEILLISPDAAELAALLGEQGVGSQAPEQKGAEELSMILIAIGGGVGIAKLVQALGDVVRKYFAGAAERDRSKKIELHFRGHKVTLTGMDHEEAFKIVKALLNKIPQR